MKILISQNAPSNMSAYTVLQNEYGAQIDFKPFFLVQPLSDKEFRVQKINLQDYTAIVFSSRHAIDAYFTLCEQMRVKIVDTTKYFCTTEVVAMYLQKHIIFRKRKIFYGDGTPASVADLITSKHAGEKFLIAATEGSSNERFTSLFDSKGLNYTLGYLVKPVSQNLKDVDINSYDYVVLYNPSDVKSLYENYPEYKQSGVKFVSFGKSIVKSMEESGLSIAIQAPTPEAPSAAKAIENYLKSLR